MHCTVVSLIVGNAFLSLPVNSFPLLPTKKNTFVSSVPSAPSEIVPVESLCSSTLERQNQILNCETIIPAASTSVMRYATADDVPAIYDLLLSLVNQGLKKRSIFDLLSMVRRNFSVVRTLQDGDNHRAIGYLEIQQLEDEEEMIGFLDKEYNYKFDYQEGDILVDIGGYAASSDQDAIDQGNFSYNFLKWYRASNIRDQLLEHNETYGRVLFVWLTVDENSSVDKCMEVIIRVTLEKHRWKQRVTEMSRCTMVGTDGCEKEAFMKIVYCPSIMSKSKVEQEAVC